MRDAGFTRFGTIDDGPGSPRPGVFAVDPQIFIAAAAPTVEGAESHWTVTLSHASTEPVTVQVRYLLGGTADDPDFHFAYVPERNATITFAPGETSKVIELITFFDNIDERDEHFVLELYNPLGGHFAPGYPTIRASAVILDDDGSPDDFTFFVSDLVMVEGDGGQRNAVFEIRLSQPAGPQGLSFNYTTRDGSAAAGSDYAARSGTVSFSDGQEYAYVSVPVFGNTAAEHSESFFLVVTPAPGLPSEASVGEAVILDDDTLGSPVISLMRAAIDEDASADGMGWVITLSEPSSTPISVTYRTMVAGTATDPDLTNNFGGAFTATGAQNNRTVTFAPGETSKTVVVRLQSDNFDEIDEHLVLELYNPTGGAVFAGGVPTLAAAGILRDNDGAAGNLALFVSDPILVEGDGGTKQALFEVRLSRPAPTAMDFAWTTADGSAAAGPDYTAASGTVAFVAGQEVAFVSIAVKGDNAAEASETFRLVVTPAAGVASQDAVGIATLLDNDASHLLPVVSLLPAAESSENGASLRFNVIMSEPASGPVTVAWRVMLDGTATAEDVVYDPTGATLAGTVTFAQGETSKSILVPTQFLGIDERDEDITLELYNASGAVLAGNVPVLGASGVILDAEVTLANPAVFVSNPLIVEGDAGSRNAVFEVRLSKAFATDIVIPWTTADGTARSGSDYGGAAGNLTIPAGSRVAYVSVPVFGDTAGEASESFTLTLSPAPGLGLALAGASGNATIIDDDGPGPVITLMPGAPVNDNAGYVRFAVTLSEPAPADISVQFSTTPGTATLSDLDDPGNYHNGTLTILAGQTSATILIRPDSDGQSESDETFYVNLFNPTGATLAGGVAMLSAVGAVLDNDGPHLKLALMTLPTATAREGIAPTPLNVELRLSRALETAVTFDVVLTGVTATAGADVQLVTTQVTFAAGQTVAAVAVDILGDALAEADETFTLSFTPVAGSPIDGPMPVITVTIQEGPGTSGNDALTGTPQADGINGLAGDDTLTGAGGDDTLDGGPGADSMTGGGGNDAYHVDVAADQTVETAAAGGIDTVFSAVTRTLGANFEHLVLTGFAHRKGTGNDLANSIAGNAGNNVLQGEGGADTLSGGEGDDELRGGTGADSMAGGLGNDRFFVDDAGDLATDGTGEGTDTVFSTVSRTLGANLEILRLQGTADINGTGNNLDNRLFGTAGANLLLGLSGNDRLEGKDGADTLSGGTGNDTLTGGGQADVFRFAATNAGADRITDFQKSVDRFQLSGGSFTALTTAANGDAILTHNGGTIRIEGINTLTLAQWNALIIPGGEALGSMEGSLGGRQAALAAVHQSAADWLL